MENIIHVFAKIDGSRLVQRGDGLERIHKRKAVAALDAKQVAANGHIDGRVIFHRVDGTIEVERIYTASISHHP